MLVVDLTKRRFQDGGVEGPGMVNIGNDLLILYEGRIVEFLKTLKPRGP
jgi:hypothetical protein